MTDIRRPDPSELDALAALWHQAWHDAHAAHVPAELTAQRTRESFGERLPRRMETTRVAGPLGHPLGLCTVMGDEMEQLMVAPEARGTGIAANLLAEAEERLAHAGHRAVWLACVIGNLRAARFYEKSGWVNARTFVDPLEVPDGTFEIEVWRFEKSL